MFRLGLYSETEVVVDHELANVNLYDPTQYMIQVKDPYTCHAYKLIRGRRFPVDFDFKKYTFRKGFEATLDTSLFRELRESNNVLRNAMNWTESEEDTAKLANKLIEEQQRYEDQEKEL